MNKNRDDVLAATQPVTASYTGGIVTARTFMLSNAPAPGNDELMIDYCLYQQVFGNSDISSYYLREIEENLPYIKQYEKLPPVLENSFYFRFRNNEISFSQPWTDRKIMHYRVMEKYGACGGISMCPTFKYTEDCSFKPKFKYEVRVLRYEVATSTKTVPSENLSRQIDSNLYPQATVKFGPNESNVLILHDFHYHPLLLQQLASELKPKTVYIPFVHDILRLSYFSADGLLDFAVEVLKNLFCHIQPIDTIAHGISCVLMYELNNRLNIDNLIFCNPPANFSYVFEEQKVITQEVLKDEAKSIYTDSVFSGSEDITHSQLEFYRSTVLSGKSPHRPNDMRKTTSTKEHIAKLYAIKASGNTEKLTCPYSEVLERRLTMMGDAEESVVQMEDNHEIYKIVNGILARISALQDGFLLKYGVRRRFHCRKYLGFLLAQFTKRTFKEFIMNLLVFAPNKVIEQYFSQKQLFDGDYFEQMIRFYELLTTHPPYIHRDSVQKVVLFPSNSAYLEDQTVYLFREVDDRDGDFFVRSIIGCGYDVFQCVPQIIANLLK